ncbi:DoxX family protein [Polycladidibacter stylochi]|uniref:DoxX family protein n=1 Tax=Polycladidibacter stylochi TaxID=1807766 RepID=UPI001AD8DC60|nr:DoxX family protein [Pseudovibrio stylochi]
MRFIFAAVLFQYFWNSALTKLGSGLTGILSPSVGAYAQILPQMMERVGYDVSQVPFMPFGLIVLLGMWAEFLLPIMIVLGAMTRLASLGFIVFIAVMSYVDVTGHHLEAASIGAWFDGNPASIIADQRFLWVGILCVLVMKGAGQLSVDYLLLRHNPR